MVSFYGEVGKVDAIDDYCPGSPDGIVSTNFSFNDPRRVPLVSR
jgi:hypothetical protein